METMKIVYIMIYSGKIPFKKGLQAKTRKPLLLHGGGVCESNTPGPALPTPAGFEVRAQHQLKLASEG